MNSSHALAEIDLPLLAETGARATRPGVERDESGVEGREENAPVTRLARRAERIDPRRDAALDECIGIRRGQVDLWIVGPPLGARLRIKGQHPAKGGDHIERAGDHERRGFECAP